MQQLVYCSSVIWLVPKLPRLVASAVNFLTFLQVLLRQSLPSFCRPCSVAVFPCRRTLLNWRASLQLVFVNMQCPGVCCDEWNYPTWITSDASNSVHWWRHNLLCVYRTFIRLVLDEPWVGCTCRGLVNTLENRFTESNCRILRQIYFWEYFQGSDIFFIRLCW